VGNLKLAVLIIWEIQRDLGMASKNYHMLNHCLHNEVFAKVITEKQPADTQATTESHKERLTSAIRV